MLRQNVDVQGAECDCSYGERHLITLVRRRFVWFIVCMACELQRGPYRSRYEAFRNLREVERRDWHA